MTNQTATNDMQNDTVAQQETNQADKQASQQTKPDWTARVAKDNEQINAMDAEQMLKKLCTAFSDFPFMQHNDLVMKLPEDYAQTGNSQITCEVAMSEKLIGNVRFGILHGGVTATMLDSIGGIQTMVGFILRSIEQGKSVKEIMMRVSKTATLDFRVDYIKPGMGSYFTATAEIVRLGQKSSTMRMQLVNEQGTIIAIATGSYVY